MRLLLTGGCGFIGSAVVRHLMRTGDHSVVNVDKMTYAASRGCAGGGARHDPRHVLVRADIADAAAMRQVFATWQPDAVMHLAAESHVDRSIDGPGPFIQTNVVGTYVLLEAAREYWAGLPRRPPRRVPLPSRLDRRGVRRARPRRCRRSPRPPPTTRAARIRPARRPPTIWCAPGTTPTACRRIVSNTCNNYGPWQFPEKLIPLVTAERAGGQDAAGLRRRLEPARLDLRRGPRRGAGARGASTARPAPPTRSARASRAATSTWCARSVPRSTRACPIPPARASG